MQVELTAAVLGAALALVGQKAVDAAWGVQVRRLRHLAALQRLELQLNRFYNDCISWRRQLTEFISVSEKGGMVFALPRPLVCDEGVLLDLTDIETREKAFGFFTDMWRLNHDFENIADGYSLLREHHWGGSIPVDAFVAQAKLLAKAGADILPALDGIENSALDLWAYVQARSEADATWIIKVRGRFIGVRKLDDASVREYRKALVTRLETSRAESARKRPAAAAAGPTTDPR